MTKERSVMRSRVDGGIGTLRQEKSSATQMKPLSDSTDGFRQPRLVFPSFAPDQACASAR
eukprot:scaffold200558_cov31-Tisochrysis_lutea.AAC.4